MTSYGPDPALLDALRTRHQQWLSAGSTTTSPVADLAAVMNAIDPLAADTNLPTGAPYPENTHRDDMPPIDALRECLDLWGSGAWPDENAIYDLDEIMGHVGRFLAAGRAAGPR